MSKIKTIAWCLVAIPIWPLFAIGYVFCTVVLSVPCFLLTFAASGELDWYDFGWELIEEFRN